MATIGEKTRRDNPSRRDADATSADADHDKISGEKNLSSEKISAENSGNIQFASLFLVLHSGQHSFRHNACDWYCEKGLQKKVLLTVDNYCDAAFS